MESGLSNISSFIIFFLFFFENKIARASSTDPMVPNLYILTNKFLDFFHFSRLALPIYPSEERSVW